MTLRSVEPQLFVADVVAAVAYYVDRLGFEARFVHGEPAFYAQVSRDGLALNLRHVDEPVLSPEIRDRDQLLAATFGLASAADLAALADEFVSRGADIAEPRTRQPWGSDTVTVRDADGNLLLFAAPSN